MNSALRLIWTVARARPQAPAVREGDRSWTYAELRAGVQGAMARLRELGVQPGHRLLVVVPTSAEFVLVYHAILALGATAVTVNPLCTPRELTHSVRDSGATLALGWHEDSSAVAATAQEVGIPLWVLEPGSIASGDGGEVPAEVETEDAAVLLYTSGTTGAPKGAVLTHGNLLACGEALSDALGLTSTDRMGTALPLFHVFGLAGVPTMWNAMLHADTEVTAADLSDLRLACSGAPRCPSRSRTPSGSGSGPWSWTDTG